MPKRPRDANQLAKMIVDISIGELSNEKTPQPLSKTVPQKDDNKQLAEISTKDRENSCRQSDAK